MAGAGARTRKDGSASAKVGSVERLKPRQIGPAVPTLGQLKAMNSAAAGARGAERRSLEARAESARAARSAHLTARGGERRTLAAAEAGAPRLNMANALGVTAEHHYTALSSQRANWYAERMKVTDPIKRATITGLIKQYDAAMPGAHAAMVAEAAAKAAKPREPGLEHFVAQRVAAKAREAERGESPRRIAAEQARVVRETNATLASGKPVLAAAQAAHAEHVAAGAAIKAMRNDAPAAEKKAAVARWNAAKAGLAEHGRRVDAELGKVGAKPDADFNAARRTAKTAERQAEQARAELRQARVQGNGGNIAALRQRVTSAEAHAVATKAKALSMVGPMAPVKVPRASATHVTSEKNTFTGAQVHRVIHNDTGKGVPYFGGFNKAQAERAAAGTRSGKTIDRLINGTSEQKARAGEAMRRYATAVHGIKYDTERRPIAEAKRAAKAKAAEAERMAKRASKRAPKPTDQTARDIAFLAARGAKHGIAFEHKDGNFHVEGRFGMQSHPLASQAKATMRNRIKQKIAGIRGERGRERSAAAAKVAEAKAVADKAQLQHNHVARQAEAARTGHVIVRTRTGEQTVKTLETHGPVVVHPTLEAPGFTVTHARSGLAVGRSETREGAVAAAQRLASPAIAKHLDAATQGDRRARSIVQRMMGQAKRAETDAALKEKLGAAMTKIVKESQTKPSQDMPNPNHKRKPTAWEREQKAKSAPVRSKREALKAIVDAEERRYFGSVT